MEAQNERAYLKQPSVYKGKAKLASSKRLKRFVRNVGLGFKTPKAASEGTYIDKKCPFVGNVSIRGRILRGVVVSTKMKRTIIVRRPYFHYVPKYNRYEKRHKNFAVHSSPAFVVHEGDQVVFGQCRPLSKTVTFNLLKVEVSRENQVLKSFASK